MRMSNNYYLNLVKDIEMMPKGSDFTAEDYLTLNNPDDWQVTKDTVEKFLCDGIDNGVITNLTVEDNDSEKVFVKNDICQGVINNGVGKIYDSWDDMETFTYEDFCDRDNPINVRRQIKRGFDEVIPTVSDFESVGEVDGVETYLFHKDTPAETAENNQSVFGAILKTQQMEEGEEFTLEDLLGEKPTVASIKLFEAYVDNKQGWRVEEFGVQPKGLNSDGVPAYVICHTRPEDD